MTNYNDLTLLLFGVFGILIHNLIKIQELKKSNTFQPHQYFGMEWPSIAISAIVVFAAILGKHEVKELEQAGKWLGLAYLTIGYMGQSILIKLFGRANKILNDKGGN